MSSTGNAPDQILLDQVRGSMEIEKMLDEEFQKHKVAPSEQEIQRYYDEHKDLFVQDPGEVRLSHIAIKLPPNATDAQKAEGMKRITKLRDEALKTKDFAALAKEELGRRIDRIEGRRPRLLHQGAASAGGGPARVLDAGRARIEHPAIEPRIQFPEGNRSARRCRTRRSVQ